ncbi:hypothetical protein HOY82DRAFT_602201 [Tuber indicum]|nr:hypothetical protein HOY82DRAFT_602201 [Tuber indicum]
MKRKEYGIKNTFQVIRYLYILATQRLIQWMPGGITTILGSTGRLGPTDPKTDNEYTEDGLEAVKRELDKLRNNLAMRMKVNKVLENILKVVSGSAIAVTLVVVA